MLLLFLTFVFYWASIIFYEPTQYYNRYYDCWMPLYKSKPKPEPRLHTKVIHKLKMKLQDYHDKKYIEKHLPHREAD